MSKKSIQTRETHILDLFTGIGGFSLAMKTVSSAKMIGYCDNDARAKCVLTKHIREGTLDDAPIYEDVSLLRRDMIKTHVDVICAGSPCQDFSVLGVQKGIFGKRSVLIFEVLRLVQELKPKMVFLENSPQIVENGLDIVVKILNRLGYQTYFEKISAAQVGAHHLRKRFFMVAYLATARGLAKRMCQDIGRILQDKEHFLFWERYPIKTTYPVEMRMLPKTSTTLGDVQRRMHLLGNALVPQMGVYALYKLAAHVGGIKNISIPYISDDVGRSAIHHEYTMEIIKEGYIENEKVKIGDRFIRHRYSTPVAGCWSMSKIGSRRSVGMLTNEVLYDREMLKWLGETGRKHILKWVINPNFIEYLMGFPKDWTK